MEEILEWQKKLAAIQLTDNSYHLSDRNCVDIILLLLKNKRVDLIFTKTGKEYLTHKQLYNEIEDEVLSHNGRINIVDLQNIINVDLMYIEEKAKLLVLNNKNIILLEGQLIANYYLDSVAEEINTDLITSGYLTLPYIAKKYSFPSSFITELIDTRIGVLIDGTRTNTTLYTASYVVRHNKKVRAAFAALTQPIFVKNILGMHNLEEILAFSEIRRLVQTNQLSGTLTGIDVRLLYTPTVCLLNQEKQVATFLSANFYIDYQSMNKLSIANPTGFLKANFKDTPLIFLDSCAILESFLEPLQASIEEMESSSSFMDVSVFLPSLFSNSDVDKIMKMCSKNSDCFISHSNYLISKAMIESLVTKLTPVIVLLAEKELSKVKETGPQILDEKEDDEPKSARDRKKDKEKEKEKDKPSKKKLGSKNDDELATSKKQIDKSELIVSLDWVIIQFKQLDNEIPDDLVTYIAKYVRPKLLSLFGSVKKQTVAGGSVIKRRKHESLMKAIDQEYENLLFFDHALETITDTSLKLLLSKYLLRTIGTRITDLLINDIALMNSVEDRDVNHLLSSDTTKSLPSPTLQRDNSMIATELEAKSNISVEQRLDAILFAPLNSNERIHLANHFLHSTKEAILAIVPLLSGKVVEIFLTRLEELAVSAEIILKPANKKREKNILFEMRKVLSTQLLTSNDPTVVLLTTILILQSHTCNTLLHAPSNAIPLLLSSLSDSLLPDAHSTLSNYWTAIENVSKLESNPNEDQNIEDLKEKLIESLDSIREIGNNFKSVISFK